MSTWIDQQDPAKILAAIDAQAKAREAGDHSALEAYRYAGGDVRFALWMYLADRRCQRMVGIGINDLGDWNSRDAYDSGTSPRAAAREALENDDTYSAFMAGADE